jgi:hypothetical protein
MTATAALTRLKTLAEWCNGKVTAPDTSIDENAEYQAKTGGSPNTSPRKLLTGWHAISAA